MPEKTELELVKDKESEEISLLTRMDNDRDLRNLLDYSMKTLKDKTKAAPSIANVTLPEPALFMSKTIAKLAGVERQPQVGGKEISDHDATMIEEFIEDMEYEVDTYLNLQGEVPAFNFHADTACSRGTIVEQIVTRVENGVFIPDIRPLDRRYFFYETGAGGMIWGAPITWRTSENIIAEYPDAQSKFSFGQTQGQGTGNRYKVTDIWNSKENIVYIDGREILRQPNTYGYPPFNVQIVPAGSVLKDWDSLKYRGESVFETLRSVFPEINFIASTLKTLNYGLFKPALTIADEEREEPPDEYIGDPGKQTMVKKAGAVQPVFTPDIKRYTTLYHTIIKELMDKAGYSSIDFGQIPFPLSGAAMARLQQGKIELLLPRLQALAYLYQARYRMVIKQYLALNEKLEIGKEGHKRSYEPSKLKGKYTIEFRYHTTTKEELASDAAIANAMGDDVSEDFKRKEIYKLADPAGEKSKLRAEETERMYEENRLYNQGLSLLEQKGREDEAEMILQRLERLIRQGKTQMPEETKVPERKKKEQMMPLFGGGGRPPTEAE